MITLIRTNSENNDFIDLVKHLDAELAERDGDEHAFYSQFNKIDSLNQAIVAYKNDKPIGCGATKKFDNQAMEIKRMYVYLEYRRKGIAKKILAELECWANELSYKKCVLETGKRQPEAIAFYKKNGYQLISNYGPYTKVENSLCFEKVVAFS